MTSYTADSYDAEQLLAVTTRKTGATVTAKLNDVAVVDGALELEPGENTLVITVAYGTTTKAYTVTITRYAAALSSLSIGALTLVPTFDAETTEYTAATSNATNAVTAASEHEEHDIVITVNGTAHENGASATWEAGDNTVLIALNGDEITYTVVVTKS